MKKTVKVITIAVVAAALGIFLWSVLCAEAESNVRIICETEQRVGPASPENFTGEAVSRGYFPAKEIGVSTGEVTFKPGARTAWHTHPHVDGKNERRRLSGQLENRGASAQHKNFYGGNENDENMCVCNLRPHAGVRSRGFRGRGEGAVPQTARHSSDSGLHSEGRHAEAQDRA